MVLKVFLQGFVGFLFSLSLVNAGEIRVLELSLFFLWCLCVV